MRACRYWITGRPPLDSVSASRGTRFDEPPIGTGDPRRARDYGWPAHAPQHRCAVAPQRPSARKPFDGHRMILERRQISDDIGLDALRRTDHGVYRERHANVSWQRHRSNSRVLIEVAERVERAHRVAGHRGRLGHRAGGHARQEHSSSAIHVRHARRPGGRTRRSPGRTRCGPTPFLVTARSRAALRDRRSPRRRARWR